MIMDVPPNIVPLTGSEFEGYILPIAGAITFVLFAASAFLKAYKPIRDASIKQATADRDAARDEAKRERELRVELENSKDEKLDALREEVERLRKEFSDFRTETTKRENDQQERHRLEMREQEERHRQEDAERDERHAAVLAERERRLMLLIGDKFTLESFISSKGWALPPGLMADGAGLPLPHTPIA